MRSAKETTLCAGSSRDTTLAQPEMTMCVYRHPRANMHVLSVPKPACEGFVWVWGKLRLPKTKRGQHIAENVNKTF